MTPDEHYKLSESWLKAGDLLDFDDPVAQRKLELLQQRALVHATLANAPLDQIEVRNA